MTPETIESIKQALVPIADKIGQGGMYAWEVLVRGQFAEGITKLILCGVFLIAYIVVNVCARRFYMKFDMSEEDKAEASMIHLGVASIAGLFVLLIISSEAYDAAIQVIAPEYAALRFLIESVK